MTKAPIKRLSPVEDITDKVAAEFLRACAWDLGVTADDAEAIIEARYKAREDAVASNALLNLYLDAGARSIAENVEADHLRLLAQLNKGKRDS